MDSAIDLTQEDFDNHPSITKISNLILPHGNNFKSRNRFNYLLIRLLIISFLFFFFFFFFEDFNRLLLDFRENTPSLFRCYRSGDVNKTLFWLCGFFVHAMEHHTRRDETLKNGCHPP